MRHHVGYFLSPLDFLKECLTFFLFKAAFNRLVFFGLFISTSLNHGMMDDDSYCKGLFFLIPCLNPLFQHSNIPMTHYFFYLTNQTPETIRAVSMTL